MPKKSNLPIEIHDHFRKATILHGYVEEHLGKASEHALEAGEELLAAKKAIPHGGWEDECNRLFTASARTARFYMQFARNMGALPKTAKSAVLMLEGSLAGASKAAKKAGKPKPPKETPSRQPPTPADPFDDDPFPPEATEEPQEPSEPDWPDDPPEEPEGRQAASGEPPKQFPRSHWSKQWQQTIGPACRMVDKIAREVGESKAPWTKEAQDYLQQATDVMERELEVEK